MLDSQPDRQRARQTGRQTVRQLTANQPTNQTDRQSTCVVLPQAVGDNFEVVLEPLLFGLPGAGALVPVFLVQPLLHPVLLGHLHRGVAVEVVDGPAVQQTDG